MDDQLQQALAASQAQADEQALKQALAESTNNSNNLDNSDNQDDLDKALAASQTDNPVAYDDEEALMQQAIQESLTSPSNDNKEPTDESIAQNIQQEEVDKESQTQEWMVASNNKLTGTEDTQIQQEVTDEERQFQQALMMSQQEFAHDAAKDKNYKYNLCSCHAVIMAFVQQGLPKPDLFKDIPVSQQASHLKQILLERFGNQAAFAQIAEELNNEKPVGEDAFPYISEILERPIFVDTRASNGIIITYHGQDTKVCQTIADIEVNSEETPLFIKYVIDYVEVEGCLVDMPPHWDPVGAPFV